jgi:radical SAM superfamily enzyme YgiQ (UPF0313 family)
MDEPLGVEQARPSFDLPTRNGARVLLSSVFGPYCQDDEYGSRAINPMELFHNQVTREQGSFSLRVFHPSLGIRLIQANISAPCTVLDFPTLEIFEHEITSHPYDIIGISSIVANVGKVKKMCEVVRALSPRSRIVVGGHVAAIPCLQAMVDADHVVKGEGVEWMRRFLGEDPEAPIRHPAVCSSFGFRFMGLPLPAPRAAMPAVVAPSVGCPMGCDFCCTSAFFGGKGNVHNFFTDGNELFDALCDIDSQLHSSAFFLLDENFLLQRDRAMQLLKRMREQNKSWALYVFSSANAIARYSIETLVELGVSWIWLGLESPGSDYQKLENANTVEMVRRLREHGITTIGSSIIGLPHHTVENLREEIEYAISHETDFHQFMLYTPMPGTPLHEKSLREGSLLPEVPYADIHGQFKFNFQHPKISRDESKLLLDWAFRRDYERNGPSVYRLFKTMLAGWRRYSKHPDHRVRRRFQREKLVYQHIMDAGLRAMEYGLALENRPSARQQVKSLRRQINVECGGVGRWIGATAAPILFGASVLEQLRVARGWRYEPKTRIERRNWGSVHSCAEAQKA